MNAQLKEEVHGEAVEEAEADGAERTQKCC